MESPALGVHLGKGARLLMALPGRSTQPTHLRKMTNLRPVVEKAVPAASRLQAQDPQGEEVQPC